MPPSDRTPPRRPAGTEPGRTPQVHRGPEPPWRQPTMQSQKSDPDRAREKSEFMDALQKGALVGAALLVLIVPPWRMARNSHAPQPPVVSAPAPTAPDTATAGAGSAAEPQGDVVA